MKLGNKLKHLRVVHNLTMQELADRCNLSKGYISQLEHNQASPSIDTLISILDIFGVSFAAFFSEFEISEKFTFKNADLISLEENDYSIKWLVPNSHKLSLEPIILTLKPFCSSQTITPFQGQIFGYILSGSAIVHYGNKANKINQGEAFYLKGNANHYLENAINKNSEILWISNPPIF